MGLGLKGRVTFFKLPFILIWFQWEMAFLLIYVVVRLLRLDGRW